MYWVYLYSLALFPALRLSGNWHEKKKLCGEPRVSASMCNIGTVSNWPKCQVLPSQGRMSGFHSQFVPCQKDRVNKKWGKGYRLYFVFCILINVRESVSEPIHNFRWSWNQSSSTMSDSEDVAHSTQNEPNDDSKTNEDFLELGSFVQFFFW